MLALTLVGGTLFLLAAFVLGLVAFVGLLIYDALAGSSLPVAPRDEQHVYAHVPAGAA